MKHVKLGEDDELVSFDNVSLFTSISVELAIRVNTEMLSNDDAFQDRTSTPADDIVDLLDFCLSTTNFQLSTTTPITNRSLEPPGLSCVSCHRKSGHGRL